MSLSPQFLPELCFRSFVHSFFLRLYCFALVFASIFLLFKSFNSCRFWRFYCHCVHCTVYTHTQSFSNYGENGCRVHVVYTRSMLYVRCLTAIFGNIPITFDVPTFNVYIWTSFNGNRLAKNKSHMKNNDTDFSDSWSSSSSSTAAIVCSFSSNWLIARDLMNRMLLWMANESSESSEQFKCCRKRNYL